MTLGIPVLGADEPLFSQTLQAWLPPGAAVAGFQDLSSSSRTPFLDAASAWAEAIGMDGAGLAEDAEVRAAHDLPREVEESLAVLLYAMADAAALQQEAVDEVSDADLQRLLTLAQDLAGSDDPLQVSHGLVDLVPSVDLDRIADAARLLVVAQDAVDPVLSRWSDRQRVAALAWGSAGIDRSLAEAAAGGDEPRPFAVLEQVLGMARSWMPRTDAPTLPAHSVDPLLAAGLEGLPAPLAAAIQEVLRAQAQVTVAAASGLSSLLEAELHLVQVLRAQGPTLEAWGAVLDVGLPLGKTPQLSAGSLSVAAAIGLAATRQQAPVSSPLAAAGLSGTTGADPRPGSLTQATAELYATLGLVLGADDMAHLQASESALPPTVAQSAAGILEAQVAAMQSLAAYEASLPTTQASALWLDDDSMALALAASDAPLLVDRGEALAEARQAYGAAAGLVAAAVERNLVPLKSTSSGPAAACDLPVDCENDVLFRDPLNLVIVTGEGSSTYGPSHMPNGLSATLPVGGSVRIPPTGQVLTLDLGGNDDYRNRAGAAYPVYSIGSGGRTAIDPVSVAVAIDLAGDDHYWPPDAPLAGGFAQGAGLGGIGILVDADGDDHYEATARSQGFAAGPGPAAGADRPELTECRAAVGGCVSGSSGIGILVDLAGTDHFASQDDSQGATIGLGAAAAPAFAQLSDLAGDDEYLLSPTAGAGHGQGAADGGLALFVDAEGDDRYQGGPQGTGSRLGFGVFVDLAGDDQHSRRHADGSPTRDGECEPAAPRADAGNPNANALLAAGFAAFVDLDDSGCAIVSRPGDVPSPPDAQGLLADLVNDSDGDGWTDGLEGFLAATGEALPEGIEWDPKDPHDYPAGFPTHAPPGWPNGFPYPPPGTDLPAYGSPFIVDIPGILAVGDSGTTVFQPSSAYQVILDLGGRDLHLDGPRAKLAIDLGEDDDVYAGDDGVQGSSGLLVDAGGDDLYMAGDRSQGAIGALDPLEGSTTIPPALGGLFDAAGDDTYIAGGTSQGSISVTGGSPVRAMAFLIDAAGSDTYSSPQQGSVTLSSSLASASSLVGVFLDRDGDDTYQPVGNQGRAHVQPSSVAGAPVIGAFIDAAGKDRYVGTPAHAAGPDQSEERNGRHRLQLLTGLDGTQLANGLAAGLAMDLDASVDADAGRADPEEPTSFLAVARLGIRVGAPTDDEHADDVALLVEPGGDDTYRSHAGSTLVRDLAVSQGPLGCPCTVDAGPTRPQVLPGLLLDLEGDDSYEPPTASASDRVGSTSPFPGLRAVEGAFAQGAGFLGAGVLVDREGNDRFLARALSQGIGVLGVGVLRDEAGDDQYAAARDVVRAPLVQGALTAWQVPEAGFWRLRVQQRPLHEPCPFDPAAGLAGSVDPAMATYDGTLVFAQRDPSTGIWLLHRVAPHQEECGDAIVPPSRIDVVSSNQRNPDADGELIVWQDDRAGEWDLYSLQVGSPAPPKVVVQGPSGSQQTDPALAGGNLVWADTRPAAGSTIRSLHLSSGLERVLSSGLAGHHAQPAADGDLVAWLWQAGPKAPSNVAFVDLATAGSPMVLAVPGGARDIDVAGGTITFTADGPEGPAIHSYRPGDAAPVKLASGTQASRDPGSPSRMVFVDSSASFDQVAMGSVGSANLVHVTAWQATDSARILQGSAWMGGVGILLDEAGLDDYSAGSFAQGAAFTGHVARTETFQREDATGQPRSSGDDPGAHGMLVDLEGNDDYRALRHAQGAHVGLMATPLRTQANGATTRFTYTEVAEAEGLLLDAMGTDRYVSLSGSQGYSELVAGAGVVRNKQEGSTPNPQQLDYPVVAYADLSGGFLMDLGGLDQYDAPGKAAFLDMSQGGVASACSDLVDAPGFPEPAQGLQEELARMNPTLCKDRLAEDRRSAPGNDRVWTQRTRQASPSGPAEAQDALSCRTGAECPPILLVGGVGIDLPIVDRLHEQTSAALAGAYSMDLLLFGAGPGGNLEGLLVAQARLHETVPDALDVRRVEFYVDGRFADYGKYDALCSCYAAVLDSSEWADGQHELAARALLGPAGPGVPLGYAAAHRPFAIDNPTAILEASVTPDLFSPTPAAYDAPPLPLLHLTVSPDPKTRDARVGVDVLGPTGAVVRTLRSMADPPVQGSLSLAWDGRLDGGGVAPSGAYVLSVKAQDDAHLQGGGAPATRSFTVRLDATQPTWGCIEVAPGCNGAYHLNLRNARPVGTGSGAEATLRFHPEGAEQDIMRHHAFSRIDSGEWTLRTQPDAELVEAFASGERREYLVLLEDAAGNVECLPSCQGPGPVQRQTSSGDLVPLLEALANKEQAATSAHPAITVLSADFNPPLADLDGRILVLPGDQRVPLDSLPRIGPSTSLELAIPVLEAETEPASPSGAPVHGAVTWSILEAGTLRHRTDELNVVQVGPAGSPSYLLAWADWAGLVAQIAPGGIEGRIQAAVEVRDGAGNVVGPAVGDILLDRTAPIVGAPTVLYPSGRQHAMPGDLIEIRVQAVDPPLSGLVEPPQDLVVELDASAVSSAPGSSTIVLDYTPLEGGRHELRGGLPLDVPAPASLQVLELPLNVTDPSGNIAEVVVAVRYGPPGIGLDIDAVRPSIRSIAVDATTLVPSRVQGTVQGGGATFEVGPSGLGTQHHLVATGLAPGVDYTVQLTAVADSGAIETGNPVTARTLSGLALAFVEPAPNQALSGVARIALEAAVDASPDAAPHVIVRLASTDGERVIADDNAAGGGMVIEFVSDALADGLYTFEGTLFFGDEETNTTIPVLIDNTPPSLGDTQPPDESVLAAGPAWLAVLASDGLSGIRADSLVVRLDGEPLPLIAPSHVDERGLVATLQAPLPPGPHDLLFSAQDLAGNVATKRVRLLVDDESPTGRLEVDYPGSQSAARPGQSVELRLKASADVASVTLAGAERLAFHRSATGWTLPFAIPLDAVQGGISVQAIVQDAAGNPTTLQAKALVDGIPPRPATLEARADGPGSAVVIATSSDASSMILAAPGLRVKALAPGERPGSLSDPGTLVSRLSGLDPGHLYDLDVTLVDGAGNELRQRISYVHVVDVRPGHEGLSVSQSADGIHLAWAPTAATFRVLRSSDGGPFEVIAEVAATQYTDADDSDAVLYAYVVQAQAPDGTWSTPGSPVVVDADSVAMGSAQVLPTEGIGGRTMFLFQAALQGSPSPTPDAWLVVGNATSRMDVSGDCRRACTLAASLRLDAMAIGDDELGYHIDVFDGGTAGSMRLPATGEFPGPVVFEAEAQADGFDIASPAAPLLMLALVAICISTRGKR